jgi:hypothetical protein
MNPTPSAATILGILLVIALGATVITLGLQTYFGRPLLLTLLGPILAATGATIFAFRLAQRV